MIDTHTYTYAGTRTVSFNRSDSTWQLLPGNIVRSWRVAHKQIQSGIGPSYLTHTHTDSPTQTPTISLAEVTIAQPTLCKYHCHVYSHV